MFSIRYVVNVFKVAWHLILVNTVLQAVNTLANVANNAAVYGPDLMSNPRILSGLRSCLTSKNPETRKAAVACVKQLVQGSTRHHKQLRDAGIDSTLRHMSDGDALPGSFAWSPAAHSTEVRDIVRYTLHLLDSPGIRV